MYTNKAVYYKHALIRFKNEYKFVQCLTANVIHHISWLFKKQTYDTTWLNLIRLTLLRVDH